MASSENFRTLVSSTDNLMTLSPKYIEFEDHEPEMKRDLLTDIEFDSVYDVTMHQVTVQDNMLNDSSSLDYLSKCTNSNKNIIDSGKDSLFVKFDPLYAKNIQLNCQKKFQNDMENDIGYETCSTSSVLIDNIDADSKSSSVSGFFTCGNDKPTQAVCPVMSSETAKVTEAHTVLPPALIRSVSAILTPTQVRPERLINLYGNTPTAALLHHPLYKYGASEVDHSILQAQDREILQVMQEKNELEFLLQTSKEDFGNKNKKLIGEIDTLQKRHYKLIQQVNDKNLSNKQIAIVIEEYEKTISMLIDEREKFVVEKEQALSNLAAMESSFNDLLTKYEKCKVVINELKDSRKTLIQEIAQCERDLKHYNNVYNTLKQDTSNSLNNASETLKNVNKSQNIEIAKLNAIIKKHEVTISSLQESLSQKTRDIEELSSICDQLINGVR